MSNKKLLIGIASGAAAVCAFLGYKKYLSNRSEVLFTEDDLFENCDDENSVCGCDCGCSSKFYEEPTENIADLEDTLDSVSDEIFDEINNEIFEDTTEKVVEVDDEKIIEVTDEEVIIELDNDIKKSKKVKK